MILEFFCYHKPPSHIWVWQQFCLNNFFFLKKKGHVGNYVSVFNIYFLSVFTFSFSCFFLFYFFYSCHFTASKFKCYVPLLILCILRVLAYPAVFSSACSPWPFPNSSLVPKDGPESGAQTHSEWCHSQRYVRCSGQPVHSAAAGSHSRGQP